MARVRPTSTIGRGYVSPITQRKQQQQKKLSMEDLLSPDSKEYISKLREEGFTVTVNEDGTLDIKKPENMSARKARYLQILYSPDSVKFTITKDGKEEEITKEEALKQAKEEYEAEIGGYEEQKRQQIQQDEGILTWAGLTVQVLTRPEVGGAFLRETKEKLEWKWAELTGASPSEVQKQMDEAYTAQMARYEAQGTINKEFEKVEKEGTWQAYASFFSPEIIFGAEVASTWGISALIGRGVPLASNFLVSKGVTTIARMKPATIAKIAGYVLMGTYFAPTISTAIKTIVYANEKQKETDDEWEKEQLERQKWAAVGTLFSVTFKYLAMAKVSQSGYRYGYGRGVQSEFVKQFPKGSPEREFVKKGFSSTRLMSKVKSKFEYEPVKPSEVTTEKFLKAEYFLQKNKNAVLSGSSASQRQIRGARLPKDYDIYIMKDAEIPKVKSLLGGKDAGFDIHGTEFYKPQSYHKQGWFTQKPVKIGGIKMLSSGEQTFRKFQGGTDYLAGTAKAGRVKDIPDYLTHMKSQIASASLSKNPITRLKGRIAYKQIEPYLTQDFTLQPIKYPKFTYTQKSIKPSLLETPTPYQSAKKFGYKVAPVLSYPKLPKLSYPIIPIYPTTTKSYQNTYQKPQYPRRQKLYPKRVTIPKIPRTYKQETKKQEKPKKRNVFEQPKKSAKKFAYEVYANGKRISKQRYTKKTALSIGADYTDKTKANKFTIKKVEGKASPLYKTDIDTIKYKFTKKGNTYYEKKQYQKDYDIERKRYKKPQKRSPKANKQFFSILSGGKKK